MSQVWYYVENGESQGPITQQEFDANRANGTIRPDTLVWKDGMGDWVASNTLASDPVSRPVSVNPAFGQVASTHTGQRSDASTFVGALKDGFSRYVDFGTRSNRPQYWYWFLWMIIIGIATSFVDGMVGTGGALNGLWTLGALLPGIAVGIRRLHDIGKSGWWLLLAFIPLVGAIVLIVFFCTKSEQQPNQWGPVPN